MQNNEHVSPDNCWNSAICKMLPWKDPIAQEVLAVEIVLEIVLFVQDLGFFVPFGKDKFHGRSVLLFNLRHSKSKGNTSSIQMCDTREGHFVTRWWKNIFWTEMWEANPTVTERNQTNVTRNRSTLISDLPTKDKYKLKAGKTTLVLLAFLIF